jgi:hypothetical protein
MIKVEMLMTVTQSGSSLLLRKPCEFILPIVKFSTDIPTYIDVEATEEQKQLILAGIHKVHNSVIAAIETIETEFLDVTEPA